MSTTVDNRVLEMRFDNKQFEQGVSTSMSTLDKLKQKLNFKGASDGLDNLGKAANRVRFDGMLAGIDAVNVQFSYLQASIQHQLNRIVDNCMNAGIRMGKALTTDPVKTGFSEYETQMGAIQTILANTQKEGTNVEIVNKALDELNEYADKTIYNFTEMTRNIGTFTAAGVKLNDSVQAIKGIANLAAISGSTSQQASTAMYQLSQALAAGRVSLMDWNSVVNAGMGGQVFQDALIRTSELLGTGAEKAIEMYGSFRESLSRGQWLTSEVLTETLAQLSGAYSKADLIAQGFTESQANEITKLAETAIGAATEVKTFTQLWDTLKESAQSGWAQTWRTIVGDFDQAKERMTSLSDTFGGFIEKMSDSRNNYLEGALTSNLDKITKKMNVLGIETGTFQDKIKELAKTHNVNLDKMIEETGTFEKALKQAFSEKALDKSIISEAIKSLTGHMTDATKATEEMSVEMEEYGRIADRVINGEFGNGEERIRKLAEAGYDYAMVQNLINEKLGDSTRHESELTKKYAESANALSILNESQKKNADSLSRLSDAQLKSKGYTEEQIEALRFLSGEADKTGQSISDLIDELEKPSGSELIWQSIFDIIESISEKFKIIGEAWHDVFGDMDSGALYAVLEDINEFTGSLTMSKEKAEQFKTIMEGIFSGLSITSSLFSMSLTSGLKILSAVLGLFGTDLMGLGETIANYIIKLKEWLDEHTLIIGTFDKISAVIVEVIKGVHSLVVAFLALKPIKDFAQGIADALIDIFGSITGGFDGIGIEGFIEKIQNGFEKIRTWIESFGDVNLYPHGIDIVMGLAQGIVAGVGHALGAIGDLAMSIIETFAGLLGIHSPSTVFIEFGKNIVEGLIQGIVSLANGVIDAVVFIGNAVKDGWNNIQWEKIEVPEGLKNACENIKEFILNFDFNKLLAVIPIGAAILMAKKMFELADILAEGIQSINGVFSGIKDIFKGFADIEKAYAKDLNAKAMRNMALSIGVLVGSVALLVSVVEDPTDLLWAVGTITVLSVVLLALATAMKKMESAAVGIDKNGIKLDGLKTGLIAIGASLLLIATTVKLMGSMNPGQAIQGFVGLGLIVGAIAGVFAVYGKLNATASYNIDKAGVMIRKLASSLLMIALVCKLVGMLSVDEMVKGVAFMGAFGVFVTALMKTASNTSFKDTSGFGRLIRSLSVSMLLLVGVCKLAGLLTVEDMLKGASFAAAFTVFVKYLIKSTTIGENTQIAKLGTMLLSISMSMMLMVGVCKLIGMLTVEDMLKGGVFVSAFIIFVKKLVEITTIGSEQKLAKVGATLIALSMAVGLMAGVSILLSMMTVEGLLKGLTAITVLGLVIAAMVRATKGATDVKASLMVMVGAIAVMAASVAALSLIDSSKLIGAAASMSMLMISLAGTMKIIGDAGLISKSALKSMALLTLVLAGVSGILGVLAYFDVGSTLENAMALGILMLALSESVNIIGDAGRISKSALKSMALLTLVLAGVAGITGVLTALDVEPSLETAAALSVVLLAMSGAARILSGIGTLATGGVAGAASMLGLVTAAGAILGVIGGLIAKIDGAQEFLDKGVPIIESLGKALGALFGGIVGGVLEGVTGSLPGMGEDISTFMENISNVGENASKIKAGSFDGVKDLIEVIGEIALTTVGTTLSDALHIFEGGSMGAFENDAISLIKAMKSIAKECTGFSFNEDGFNIIIDIAKSLSKLQKSIGPIGGFTSMFTGEHRSLEYFAKDATEFIEAMKSVANDCTEFSFNRSGFEIIIEIATELSKLQKSFGDIGGFTSMFTGENVSLEKFSNDAAEFIGAMKSVANNCTGFSFDSDGFNTIVEIATRLSEFQKSIGTVGGIASIFTGENISLESFSNDAAEFIGAMKSVANNCTGFSFDSEGFENIMTVATRLSELQGTLEPMGGVIDWFTTGKHDLGTFGNKIKDFAAGMSNLKDSLGEGTISPEMLTSVVDAAKKLSELSKVLPEDGWFDGKMDLSDFGSHLFNFGSAMSKFGNATANIDSEQINVAIDAANRIKTLINSLVGIDVSGLTIFTGIGTGGLGADGAVSDIARAISDFCSKTAEIDTGRLDVSISAALKLKDLIAGLVGLDTTGIANFKIDSIGTALSNYGMSVATIDTAIVASSVTSATRLKDLIVSMVGLDASGVSMFTSSIPQLGASVGSYAASVANIGLESIAASIITIHDLIRLIGEMVGIDTSGVSAFKTAITELGTIQVSSLVSAFEGASAQMVSSGVNLITSLISGIQSASGQLSTTATSIITTMTTAIIGQAILFTTIGETLISNLSTGISNKTDDVTTAVTNVVTSAASGIDAHYGTFQSSGNYLGEGLVIGIQAMEGAAYDAGYALGQAAARGEKDGQDSHSPSKLTIQSGKWLGEGLVIGIEKMGKKVYKSGYHMGERATQAVSNAIARVSNLIDSDIDAEPTIRPVLDLSNVKSGAGVIDGLFKDNRVIGLSANLSSVNAAMSRRNQNGANDDVVNAIDKLRKALGDVGGNTTYNVNGVTYDDGSNVTEAVKALVRAAKVERRV